MDLNHAAHTETQLLRRVALGDQDAYSELYNRYETPLYCFAMLAIGNSTDAEVFCEEVLMRIWELAPRFDEAATTPFSWAMKIALNKVAAGPTGSKQKGPQGAKPVNGTEDSPPSELHNTQAYSNGLTDAGQPDQNTLNRAA